MKSIFCAAAITLLMAATVSAQIGPGLNIYGGAGLTVPTSDLSDLVKSGYHGMVGVGLRLVPTLETVARFGYHSLSLKDEVGTDGDFTVSEYGLDVRANLSAPTQGARPYALIGAGWAKFDYPEELVAGLPEALGSAFGELEPETKFFYCFGGGIKVTAAPKMSFFLEARFTKLSIKEATFNYFPITVGLNLSI